jgi:hypothetical protein
MIKTKLFAALFFSIILSLSSKGQADHLKPVEGMFSEYSFQFEYYSKVRKILFAGLSDQPEIRFVVIPSFETEEVLDIEKLNDKYYLVYQKCRKSIWYSKDIKEVKVDKVQKEIDWENVDLIKKLYKAAIFQTRFEETKFMGVDGNNYYFSINDVGMKSGVIWSPNENTKMAKLVNVSLELIRQMGTETDKIDFDKKFIEKVTSLVKEFE